MHEREIKDSIMKLAETHGKDYLEIIIGSVLSVDENERTCTVKQVSGDADNEIPDVKLVSESNDGFIRIPAVDSTVILAVTKNNVPFVLMFSECEKIYSIQDEFQFNDGAFGGLIKINDLVSKMNTIENKINTIINTFNTHTHPVSGSATTTPVTPIVGTITNTTVSDLENPNITHG